MEKYLVTGGAGFIGSHIVEELVKTGQDVRVVDNFITGKKENIALFLDHIELIEGDIRDLSVCRAAVKERDYVLHQAALPSVPKSLKDPLLTNTINIEGTLNVLLAAKDAGIKRLVFASSSSVYGDNPDLPKKEDSIGLPLSPYAVSKWAGERYCQVFSKTFDFSTVCLRYFNVFGPRQDPHSQYAAVVPHFVHRILKGESPIIYGDGEQSRDFTHVANIVKANLAALKTGDAVSGQVVNIGCGEQTTVNTLVVKINDILGSDIKPLYTDPRPGDVKHSYADVSRAQEILQFQPGVTLEEGLARTIRWYQDAK